MWRVAFNITVTMEKSYLIVKSKVFSRTIQKLLVDQIAISVADKIVLNNPVRHF